LTQDQPPSEASRTELPPEEPLPWTVQDTWIGIGLLFFVVIVNWIAQRYGWASSIFYQTFGIVVLEFSLLIPILLIFAWRKVSWATLGFRKFKGRAMRLGCSLLLAAYVIIIVYNSILLIFHVSTQGVNLIHRFDALKSPIGFIVAAVLVAPFVEEMSFRGFVFQGFRQRYGWNGAAILSAIIFAIFHLQIVALVPIFVIGYVLAQVYHRSSSIWPGIMLHSLINSLTVLSLALTGHVH